MFNFYRHFQTLFQSRWTIWEPHKQCAMVSVSPHPCQYLLTSVFFVAILVSVNWCLNVHLICIFLKTNDVNHFIMCHLKICLFGYLYIFFEEMSLQSLFNWKLGYLSFLLSCKNFLCIFWIQVACQIWFTNITSHSVAYVFIFLMVPFEV